MQRLFRGQIRSSNGVDRQSGSCGNPSWVNDQYCDDGNNNAGCNWDGGDCCGNEVPGWDDYCDECACKEPDSESCSIPEYKGNLNMYS